MDFSPDISERIDTLSRKCIEKKKVILDFISLLQARAELEEYYSRSLEKIGESLTKLIHGKDCMKDLFVILRSYFQIQSEQTRTFARQIKNDVIIDLEQYLQKEEGWQKEMQFIKQKHQKEIRRNIESLNCLRDEYIQSINEEKKYQLNKSIQKKLSYRQSEIKLQNFIAFYNQYIESYFRDIATVQDKFQNIELDRRKNIQDSAIKFFMFEISVVRNLQYDLNGISQKSEQYNPKNELNELFKDQPNDKPLLSKLNFENYKQFIQSQLGFKPDPTLNKKKKPIFDSIQPLEVQPEVNQQFKETNQIFVKVFQSALFNNIITDETVQKLNELLPTTQPIIYVQSLERVLKLRLSQEDASINTTDHEVSPEGYVSLLKLIMPLFDYCNKSNSYAQVIIQASNLAKTIYKTIVLPDVEMKMCLFEGLIQHPVLKNQQIWLNYANELQSLLINDTNVFAENKVTSDLTRKQIDEYIEQLKNISCSQEIIEAISQQLKYDLIQENPLE